MFAFETQLTVSVLFLCPVLPCMLLNCYCVEKCDNWFELPCIIKTPLTTFLPRSLGSFFTFLLGNPLCENQTFMEH